MKLAIVGPSRCGKDTAGFALARVSTLRYTGFCTSQVILPHAAIELGLSEQEAWETRHQHRPTWRRIGDDLRAHDAAHLARQVLREQDVCVGVRSRREILAAQSEGLVALTIWVDADVPPDETLEYGPELADIIVPNRQSLRHLEARLTRLAASWGVLRGTERVDRRQGSGLVEAFGR
jgi:hypothetical protein